MTTAPDRATAPACLELSLADYPGMNPFVLDWLSGRADSLLPRRAGEKVPQADEGVSPELTAALIESNKRWGLFVRDEVESWARGESVALIAGQQVGFAGGPLYTLAKIASLLKLKRQFKSATVFFWLATEDHDFDEAATLSIPVKDRQLDLAHIAISHSVDSKAMVGP